MSNFSQYTDNNEKKWWKGEETQNQQIQEYNIETEGKYIDRDIKLKVSIPSATFSTSQSLPSGKVSKGTIENGTYLKISAGFNPGDTYYLAQEFSENEAKEILGEATFDKSWNTGLISQELPLLYTLPEENSSNEYYTISAYSEGSIYCIKTGYINQNQSAKSFQDYSTNAYIKKFTGKYTTND